MGCSKIKKVLSFTSMLILLAAFCLFRTPTTMGEITLNEEERAALLWILKGTKICGKKRYEPSCGYIKSIGLFCGNDYLALKPRGDNEFEVRDAGYILDDKNNQRIREFIGM